MKKVSIIGAGQLGSRHLQGMKTAQNEMEIWVIDALEQSLKVAKERYEQVEAKSKKVVHYANTIETLPEQLDLVVIATSSIPRANIIKTLLARSSVKYLVLEKFLFTRLHDYDEILELLLAKGVRCWVNCPRRMWPAYQQIQLLIDSNKPVIIEKNGKDWGMCCNSVHFIDIWMYLAGDSEINVNLDGVIPEVQESKRNGYIELFGKECFNTIKGDKLFLSCYADYANESSVIIKNDGNTIIVDELSGSWSFNGEEHIDKTPYQSGLTGVLADDILDTGECRISPYHLSSQYHKSYLKAVMQFVNKLQGCNSDACPIT